MAARAPPFLLVLVPNTIAGNERNFLAHREREYMTSKQQNKQKKWKNINQNSNPSWHKQPVYRYPPSADVYSPTKRNCGKWGCLHRPRYCLPWLSDTFARNTASTSTEPHKTKKYEKIRKEQKGEERNRKPFLFFAIPLQRISKNCLQLSLIVDHENLFNLINLWTIIFEPFLTILDQ